MPPKRKDPRKWGRRRPAGRVKKGTSAKSGTAGLNRRLDELIERIDVVLPEVTARVAALEHLLLELNLCSLDDLRGARQFVRIQEA
jgi:Holliday junction resolvasome RuvABC endonuclease subunit